METSYRITVSSNVYRKDTTRKEDGGACSSDKTFYRRQAWQYFSGMSITRNVSTANTNIATLEAYLREHDDPFLRTVLEWSRRADELFQREVEALPPFRGVLRALKKAYGRADVAVISSASESSLRSDWKKEDLLRYVASTGHEPVYIDLPDPRAEE